MTSLVADSAHDHGTRQSPPTSNMPGKSNNHLAFYRGLPSEIRLQIWKYALPKSVTVAATSSTDESSKFKLTFDPPFNPAITQLNKETREEALSVCKNTLLVDFSRVLMMNTINNLRQMPNLVKSMIRSLRVHYEPADQFRMWSLIALCRDWRRSQLYELILDCHPTLLTASILSEPECRFLMDQMIRRWNGDIIFEFPAVKVEYWQAIAQLRRNFVKRFDAAVRGYKEGNAQESGGKQVYFSSRWIVEPNGGCRLMVRLSLSATDGFVWSDEAPPQAEPLSFQIDSAGEEGEFERTFKARFVDT